jgi:hypothetical protein
MDKFKVLNYATDAIDDLQYFIGISGERGDRGAAQATQALVSLMRRGVKFLLPNCAEIVDKAFAWRGTSRTVASAVSGHCLRSSVGERRTRNSLRERGAADAIVAAHRSLLGTG